MCARVKCSACGKPSFSGCGRHVEQVLGDVPVEKRCTCHEQPPREAKENTGGLIKRLFGG